MYYGISESQVKSRVGCFNNIMYHGAKRHAFCGAIWTIVNVHVDHSDQPGAGKREKECLRVPIEVNLSPDHLAIWGFLFRWGN